MGHPERKTASDLVVLPPASLKNYSFFQLVELLAKKYNFDLEQLDKKKLNESLFCFKTNASLGFPASEISSIEVDNIDSLGHLSYKIEVNFLGLHGASSPLPGFLLEEIAYEFAQKTGIKADFLDFFNHRLNVYLHQIWRKYRYYIQFKVDAKDQFSNKVFSFIGLNDDVFRQKARLNSDRNSEEEMVINWGKLLSFSGLVASRSRSPSIVAGIIKHYFGLNKVEILEWQPRVVEIAKNQLNSLGMLNNQLGDSFIIGSKVLTRSSKFVVVINELKEDIFHSFLPIGKSYAILKTLIAFLTREQMSYDLKLGLIQKDIPPFEIKKENHLFLGWNTFIGNNNLLTESVVTIKGED